MLQKLKGLLYFLPAALLIGGIVLSSSLFPRTTVEQPEGDVGSQGQVVTSVDLTTVTTNITPQTANSGSVGTAAKPWGFMYASTGTFDYLVVNFRVASGTIQATDGSSSTPSYTFASATGLGFYKASSTRIGVTGQFEFSNGGVALTGSTYSIGRDNTATNRLVYNVPTGVTQAWQSNATDQMVLNSSGILLLGNNTSGVGTGYLSVQSQSTVLNAAQFAGAAGQTADIIGVRNSGGTVLSSINNAGSYELESGTALSASFVNNYLYGRDSADWVYWNIPTSSPGWKWMSASSTLATLTSAGRLGIATTSPISVFAVAGTSTFQGDVSISGGTAGNALCKKANGTIGTCSSVVGAGGDCTCS